MRHLSPLETKGTQQQSNLSQRGSFMRKQICLERDDLDAAQSSAQSILTPANAAITLAEIGWLVAFIVVMLIILHMSATNTAASASLPEVPLHSSNVNMQLPLAATNLPTPSVQRTGELETRAALERLFGKPFPKIRPSWLVNSETNRRLELDCWNEEVRVAVEYSGLQHFVFPNPFHRTLEEFQAQQRRDATKVKICRERGIYLVIVPHTVSRAHIQAFLRQQLEVLGFQFNA